MSNLQPRLTLYGIIIIIIIVVVVVIVFQGLGLSLRFRIYFLKVINVLNSW
jgi:hypothetical protein